jgi:hypothetical protein
LQQRAVGQLAWSAGTAVKANSDGTISVPVKVRAPAQFRLVSGTVSTSVATLRVKPLIRLELPTVASALAGFVKPAIANARVQVQRMGAAGWSTVATVRTADDGTFSAALNVSPATYRARVLGENGWGTAVSPELRVVKT